MQSSISSPTYQEGIWVPTWGGFSVNPVVADARYVRNGGKCRITLILTSTGTSNAVTCTIGGLPFKGISVAQGFYSVLIVDNGTQSDGRFQIDAGSVTTGTFFKTMAGGAFTGSGGKGSNFSVEYLITVP